MAGGLRAGVGSILKSAGSRVAPARAAAAKQGRRLSDYVSSLRTSGRSSGAVPPAAAPRAVPRPPPVTPRGNPYGPVSGGRTIPTPTGTSSGAAPRGGGNPYGPTSPGPRKADKPWTGALADPPMAPRGNPYGPTSGRHVPKTTGTSSGAGAAAKGPGWIRRNPGKALGIGAVGLGAMNLRRNTGPGATGNGYMPPGSSSGGRGF